MKHIRAMIAQLEQLMPDSSARQVSPVALVQIADYFETIRIDEDTFSIKQVRIPDARHSGIFEPESAEVELPLANAMYQFNT